MVPVLTNLAKPDDSYSEYRSMFSSTLKLWVLMTSLIVTNAPLIELLCLPSCGFFDDESIYSSSPYSDYSAIPFTSLISILSPF